MPYVFENGVLRKKDDKQEKAKKADKQNPAPKKDKEETDGENETSS